MGAIGDKSSRNNALDVQHGNITIQHNYAKWMLLWNCDPIGFLHIAVGCTVVRVVRGKFFQWVHMLHPQPRMVIQSWARMSCIE